MTHNPKALFLLLISELGVGFIPFLLYEGIREYQDREVCVVGALWVFFVAIHVFVRRESFYLGEPPFPYLSGSTWRLVLMLTQGTGMALGAWLLFHNPIPKGPTRW